jgi:gamma-glutamyltranspeptidase/glutathione hydrolase
MWIVHTAASGDVSIHASTLEAPVSRLLVLVLALAIPLGATARTVKPVLHGQHWVAITGKPLAATAGAQIFQQGGNAVDAACAMLAATATMFDVLSWGGETQALIFNPHSGKVIAINALGVAPTGATPAFFRERGMAYPPEFGPLAAVTPGTPGGLLVMLAAYGSMPLAAVLAPAIEMADGYPIEAQSADTMERFKDQLRQWPYSKQLFLVHEGEVREAPVAGEIFRQPDLAATLRKLVQAETDALAAGASRHDAIMAAYQRFYKGDIGEEFVRASREMGGLHTMQDLAGWQVHVEEPVMAQYKGIDVYKLNTWVQGPVMLQALNMLESMDVRSLGYNSAQYLHTLYQVMNLAFADRDFYYGDPYFPPAEPIAGLLSKAYAADRVRLIDHLRNDPGIKPGDPYPYQDETNPFADLLDRWTNVPDVDRGLTPPWQLTNRDAENDVRTFALGTTTVQAADREGWVVSMTPSGGWLPAVIAGRTGMGMSQRMQSFVLDAAQNPFNVLAPGKRPRATLTPGLALKDGKPFLSFAVQGGDLQDQALLQFFLNVVEFGMNVQEATEAANIVSYQMRDSFADHAARPGVMEIHSATPPWVQAELKRMGYELHEAVRTSGPINAIWFDRAHGTFWGGSSDYGEDYGIAW